MTQTFYFVIADQEENSDNKIVLLFSKVVWNEKQTFRMIRQKCEAINFVAKLMFQLFAKKYQWKVNKIKFDERLYASCKGLSDNVQVIKNGQAYLDWHLIRFARCYFSH